MGEGGSGRDRELGVIRYNLEWIYKEILLSSIEILMSRYLYSNRTKDGKKNVYM